MAVAAKNNYDIALKEQQKEVRNMVLAGLENIKEGKTKDFNEVCDRLEKKYRNVAVQNQNQEYIKTYYREYKIFYTIDDNVKEVFIVRILHMLVDSRAWLYRTFGIPS